MYKCMLSVGDSQVTGYVFYCETVGGCGRGMGGGGGRGERFRTRGM